MGMDMVTQDTGMDTGAVTQDMVTDALDVGDYYNRDLMLSALSPSPWGRRW
jgi:hypothetical protein